MTTVVVNIKREGCDQFIGRPGPYGNPYKIGKDGDRVEVVHKYRTWFREAIKDLEFRESLEKLRGQRLGCFCKPVGGDSIRPLGFPIVMLHNGLAYLDVVLQGQARLSCVNNPATENNVVLRVPLSGIDSINRNRPRITTTTPIWKLHLDTGVEAFAFLPLEETDKEVSGDVGWLYRALTSGACKLIHPLGKWLIPLPTQLLPAVIKAMATEIPGLSSRSREGGGMAGYTEAFFPRTHPQLELVRLVSHLFRLNPQLIRYPLPPEVRIPLEKKLNALCAPFHDGECQYTPEWGCLSPNIVACHGDVIAQYLNTGKVGT